MNWKVVGASFVNLIIMVFVAPILNGAINAVIIGYTLKVPVDLAKESFVLQTLKIGTQHFIFFHWNPRGVLCTINCWV